MEKTDGVGEAEKEATKEYTEFLKEYLGKRRDITKKVFKIGKRIYKAVQNGVTEEQVNDYIVVLKRLKH